MRILSKKAQMTSLSVILITAIVLTIIVTSYVWGKGLIDAQRTRTTVNYMETKMLEFKNAIREVSHEGVNSTRLVRFDISEGKISIETGAFCSGGSISKNMLLYNISTPSQFVESETIISIDPIETNTSCSARYENNTASVLLAHSTQISGMYSNAYMLWFRQLNDTSGNGFLINLTAGDTVAVSGGAYTAIFRNSGTFNNSGIIVTNVTVDFV